MKTQVVQKALNLHVHIELVNIRIILKKNYTEIRIESFPSPKTFSRTVKTYKTLLIY